MALSNQDALWYSVDRCNGESEGFYGFLVQYTNVSSARSNPGVMGGKLRETPTFIINFRLPWGLLLAYFEIPERFVPFVKAA